MKRLYRQVLTFSIMAMAILLFVMLQLFIKAGFSSPSDRSLR